MANYKVAYGKKENMNYAIERGIIPPGCIILTEDTAEIFFYDLNRRLKAYEDRYKFESLEEANEWLEKYDCSGQVFSVHEGDKCTLYLVDYENNLSPISGSSYVEYAKDPTESDNQYEVLTNWVNTQTKTVFILVSVVDGKAEWKKSTISHSDLCYEYVQTNPSTVWKIQHSLNKLPAVTVLDDRGELIVGDINYIDKNNLEISFNVAVAGRACIN